LNLNDNQLTSLPSEVGNLSSLRRLFLTDNRLTSLPPEIGRLSSLEALDLASNQLVSLPSSFFNANFRCLYWGYLVDNCLIALPPTSAGFTVDTNGQRLPATLDACSFDIGCGHIASSRSSSVAEFALHFYDDTDTDNDNDGNETKMAQLSFGCIRIADRDCLSRQWPFFRHLLDANLSEARSGHVDLSRYFSLRLGQCLIDYFEGKSVQVSSLQTQDCRDFVEHADYFGLSDTLLLAFCIAKLRKEREEEEEYLLKERRSSEREKRGR
jgi:hypothetical protein